MELQERVSGIIAALKDAYPDPVCALQYKKDYELMIAVRLSAQCTDERVNKITPALFARFPTLDALADADIAEVEDYVRSCGFYKHKARDIVLACQLLREKYGGKVPAKVETQLRAILPPEESSDFCHRLVLHGRAVCIARRPQCSRCCLAPYCRSFSGQ